jgi:hypothetical protein
LAFLRFPIWRVTLDKEGCLGVSLRFSGHAQDRLSERRITEEEVEEALDNSQVETPGRTADRVNKWGDTEAGRMLRVTVYRDAPDFVLSVVAPEEEP